MTKSLIKSLICFILTCSILATACIVLYAAGSSPYLGRIMVATLNASKSFTGDSFSAYTRDNLNDHTCSLSYNVEPYYDALIRMYVVCYIDIGDADGDGDIDYDLQTYSCREESSSYTLSGSTGFGKDLDHVLSEHRLNLYCESLSDVCTLQDVAS